MQKLHTKLTQKYPKYNNWHQTKHHNKIHWGVLVVFTFLIFGTISLWTPISLAADIAAPTTPTGLTVAAISSSQINLSWTASTDDVGVAGYKIYRDGQFVNSQSVNPLIYNDTGLTASTAYTYAVSAYDAAGNNSAQSTSASATTLSQSQTILFQDNFSDGLMDGWTVVDEGTSAAPSKWAVNPTFRLTQTSNIWGGTLNMNEPKPGTYAYYNNGFTWNDYETNVALNNFGDDDVIGVMFRYQDQNNYYRFSMSADVSYGIKYQRLIKKVNGAQTTLAENLTPFTLSTWHNLKITAQGNRIQVYLDSALIFDVIDSSLISGSIAMYSWANTGAYFDDLVVNDFVPPPADTTPPTVSITSPINGATVSGVITITADATDNIGVSGVQFKLDGANLQAEDTISPYSISWDTTTASNASHIITATARDAAGNQAISAAVSITVSNALDIQAPTTPTNLTATAVSSSQINLSWTASNDNTAVTGYKIYRCAGLACAPAQLVNSQPANSLTYSDTGLTASTVYTYAVSAYDAAGNESGQSTSASGTTLSQSILFQDNFSDGLMDGWIVVDEGTNVKPSKWAVNSTFRLTQTSNIWGGTLNMNEPKPGTYAYYNNGFFWADYETNLSLGDFGDDDVIGVMFRYQDQNNYYRFSMSADVSYGIKYQRLIKKVNGAQTTLAENLTPFTLSTWHNLKITAQGNRIQVYLDNNLVFDVADSSITSGSIAMYSWANTGAYFDDLVVNDLTGVPAPPGLLISSSSPFGFVQGTQQNLSVATHIPATCKYDINNLSYENLANIFSVTGGVDHIQPLNTLSEGQYVYYVACSNGIDISQTKKIDFYVTAKKLTKGLIHEHTANGGGAGTYDGLFGSSTDFIIASDHDSQLTDIEWTDCQNKANLYNVDGQKTAFCGFEWWPTVSVSKQHIVVFNTQSIARNTNPLYDTLPELYSWIKTNNASCVLAHPWYGGNVFNISNFDGNACFGVGVFNDSGIVSPTKNYNYYYQALGLGYKVQPIGEEDEHKGVWNDASHTFCWEDSLNRTSLVSSFNQRRCYAVSNGNIQILAKSGDSFLGDSIPAGANTFQFQVYGDYPSSNLILKKNGVVLVNKVDCNDKSCALSLNNTSNNGDYYTVEVILTSGNEAIASAFFVQ